MPASAVNPKTYAPAPAQSVAFLGLGVMGLPMAGHLALAGHRVTVYNRSPAKVQAWLAAECSYARSAQLLHLVLKPHLGGLCRLRVHGRVAVRAWDSASSAPKQRW